MRFISGNKNGFTLLETLIAFSVFSVFVIAVHKSFVSGLKGQETASWSNMIGQMVRSEFALVEVGLPTVRTYEKKLGDDHRLEVEISELPLDQILVPVSGQGVFEVTVKVKNLKDRSEKSFKKIVFLEGD